VANKVINIMMVIIIMMVVDGLIDEYNSNRVTRCNQNKESEKEIKMT